VAGLNGAIHLFTLTWRSHNTITRETHWLSYTQDTYSVLYSFVSPLSCLNTDKILNKQSKHGGDGGTGTILFRDTGPGLWHSLPSHLKNADLPYNDFRRSVKDIIFCLDCGPQRSVNFINWPTRNIRTYLLSQSARISKIINDGLAQSGTRCFIAVPICMYVYFIIAKMAK